MTNIEVNPQRLAYLMVKSLFQAGHKEVLLAAPEFSDVDTDVLAMGWRLRTVSRFLNS
jgi:hypothetical protein